MILTLFFFTGSRAQGSGFSLASGPQGSGFSLVKASRLEVHGRRGPRDQFFHCFFSRARGARVQVFHWGGGGGPILAPH